MARSIEDARGDVEHAVRELVACADTHDGRFAAFEAELSRLLLAVGRAVVLLFLVRRAGAEQRGRYSHGGGTWSWAGWRTTELGTRVGKVGFTRQIGRRTGLLRNQKADLPLDRELGLVGGFSLGAATLLTRLCAQMAFASARSTFAAFVQWAPSPRATLRIIDAIGAHARRFIEGLPAPENDGEFLVVEVDGGGAPMITAREHRRRKRSKRARGGRHDRRDRRRANPRPRRTKGKKSKNSKVAFVGVLFTLRRMPDGTLEGPINKRIIATFESHRALFAWLHREAVKRGYGTNSTVFIADGSDHIWRLQKEFFPLAVPCLDWWHADEKLWEAGACIYREGSPALRAWVQQQRGALRRGGIGRVLTTLADARAAIPKTGPGNKGKRERLLDIQEHFAKNQHRMRYDRLRREDLDIGSGAVEGAVRNLVRVRLDGPGMRWGRDRAELLLHLRCVLLNGQWEAFEKYLAPKTIALAAKPVPARTHDAAPNPLAEAA